MHSPVPPIVINYLYFGDLVNGILLFHQQKILFRDIFSVLVAQYANKLMTETKTLNKLQKLMGSHKNNASFVLTLYVNAISPQFPMIMNPLAFIHHNRKLPSNFQDVPMFNLIGTFHLSDLHIFKYKKKIETTIQR